MINLIRPHLRDREIDDFAEWAFGDNYKKIFGSTDFLKEWNARHSSKYTLRLDGIPKDDVVKMIKLWKDEQKTKKEKV